MINLTTNKTDELILFNSLIDLGEKSGHAYTILDASFHFIHQNHLHEALTGFSFDEFRNLHFSALIGNSKSAHLLSNLEQTMLSGTMTEMTIVHKKCSAKSFTGKLTCIPLQINQQTKYILILLEDVTVQKIKQSIKRMEQQLLHTFDQSVPFIQKLEHVCYELNYVMTPHCFSTIAWYQNDMITLIENLPNEKSVTKWIVQNDPRYAVYKNLIATDSYQLLTPIIDLGLDHKHVNYAVANHFESAIVLPIKVSTGEQKGAIIIYFDEITRDTKPFNSYFEKLTSLIKYVYTQQNNNNPCIPAFLDASLKIPNRRGIHYFLEQKEQPLQEKPLTIMLLSPNEYTQVIELYGRDAGERLLKEIIYRISNYKGHATVLTGRFSSSTLYVVLEGEIDINLLSTYIQSKVSRPIQIDSRTIYLTMKTGIATQRTGDCIEETVRKAELALSNIRKKSGTHFGIYDEKYANKIEKEVVLLNHLTEAIEHHEIQVYFQPKIELHRGRIDSVEALARWVSPTLGFISPADFIPIAEKNGLIHKIDLLMIEQVLAWMQQRQYEGKRIVPVSVNISAEHFYHPNFIDQLMALIHKYYADPKYLIIEITETLGLEDLERAQKIINQLNLLNFTVSVDDFGIGYSSLSYLQKLSFRELKIDMSFVRRLEEVGTCAIVRAIIDIAKNLEMRVIAEGVETEKQVKMLKELGCDVAQGYFYYKPIPISAIDF